MTDWTTLTTRVAREIASPALAKVSKARKALVLDSPFFGFLSLRLELLEAPEQTDTMATDGTMLYVNPERILAETDAVVRAWVAHEVLHCALLHPWRVGARDLELANEAADHVVNEQLEKAGVKLWPGAKRSAEFDGMTFEQVYSILLKRKMEKQPPTPPQPQPGQPDPQAGQGQPKPSDQPAPANAPGKGKPSDGDNPSFRPAPAPDADGKSADGGKPSDQPGKPQPDKGGKAQPKPQSEQDWKVAAEQAAMVGRKRGTMPGSVSRALVAAREPVADWKSILRQFVEQQIAYDVSWSTPNRRFIAEDLYLPGAFRENVPPMVVMIDTSGSISQREREVFAAEAASIARDVRPELLVVVYCDSRVQHVDTWQPDDDVVIGTARGGGTAFQPAFDHINALVDAGDLARPACALYLTDLDGDRPIEPDYPVLWITSGRTRSAAPWGETIRLEDVA